MIDLIQRPCQPNTPFKIQKRDPDPPRLSPIITPSPRFHVIAVTCGRSPLGDSTRFRSSLDHDAVTGNLLLPIHQQFLNCAKKEDFEFSAQCGMVPAKVFHKDLGFSLRRLYTQFRQTHVFEMRGDVVGNLAVSSALASAFTPPLPNFSLLLTPVPLWWNLTVQYSTRVKSIWIW